MITPPRKFGSVIPASSTIDYAVLPAKKSIANPRELQDKFFKNSRSDEAFIANENNSHQFTSVKGVKSNSVMSSQVLRKRQ